jgi:F0F1-type ATP synthase membrane subunit b/b'
MVQSAIIVAILLFVLHDKRFNGPPIGEEIKRRQAAIAAAEKAISQRADDAAIRLAAPPW